MGWQRPTGAEWHDAAMSGRPILAFGTPRYGHSTKCQALVHFETGQGWRESNNNASFEVEVWMPLQPNPDREV